MTHEQLLALVALERDAFYGGNPIFNSLSGEGIASEPRSGASRANGSTLFADAPSPVETFAGSPAGEEQHLPQAGQSRHPAGVVSPDDARPPSSGGAA